MNSEVSLTADRGGHFVRRVESVSTASATVPQTMGYS
jgi:hypothetical protein